MNFEPPFCGHSAPAAMTRSSHCVHRSGIVMPNQRNRSPRVRALIAEMRARNRPIGTVAAVLAEVVRGRAADASVFAGLRRERVEVYPVDTRTGVRAGQLLGRLNASSELAVDAFVVAVADIARGAVIASVDVSDLERLASHAARVVVADIG